MSLGDIEVLPATTADSMSEGEAIASVLIPWPQDDNKAKYLRLRACGHAVRETLRHLGLGQSTLSAWRKDDKFNELEIDLPNTRKVLAKEWIELAFTRNFSLSIMKDTELLEKSRRTRQVLDADDKPTIVPIPLTKQEHEWLMKRTALYTPQQLAAVEALNKSNDSSDSFNWENFMLEVNRSTGGPKKITAREIEIELPDMSTAHAVDC